MTTLNKKNYSNCAVIIPTYNERKTIVKTVRDVLASLPGCHIWVVDDNSPDGTSTHVKRFRSSHVTLLQRSSKNGRGSAVWHAMREVYKHTRYTRIIEMDADYSHDPHELPALVAASRDKTIAIGSRYIAGSRIEGWPLTRKILSAGANRLIRLVLRLPLHDATNGFRCYSREAVSVLLRRRMVSAGFVMLSESAYILYKQGYMFTEIPSHFVDRKKGLSNATPREFLDALVALLHIRRAYV
ncbi:MAG: polyprenol monophosphomannose synthase [Candidatus Roizmanbacteria bacterium]|nr:polyprenol monophosphomannose synthase [Candidatus Roizmanbacteria bacterium]